MALTTQLPFFPFCVPFYGADLASLVARLAILTGPYACREFLRENLYYDASVVMRMLSEQRLYELLYHCAQGLMVVSRSFDEPVDTGDVLEYFPVCVTDPDLLLPLSCDLSLLGTHLRLLADLLPRLEPDLVQRVARMYDASRPGPALALRRILLASSRQGRSTHVEFVHNSMHCTSLSAETAQFNEHGLLS
ncbi:hypothetical protein HPB51_021062 [Rhipicephalus microplus]|uniref:Uncharacterized protein n=1 Tax=Rhipicephalus microplus TaxID=6941 RepID=A0A9J6EC67_RHIMP|nr:hypothetical protein HPB51_021062 [Rhipicephalus microplus]